LNAFPPLPRYEGDFFINLYQACPQWHLPRGPPQHMVFSLLVFTKKVPRFTRQLSSSFRQEGVLHPSCSLWLGRSSVGANTAIFGSFPLRLILTLFFLFRGKKSSEPPQVSFRPPPGFLPSFWSVDRINRLPFFSPPCCFSLPPPLVRTVPFRPLFINCSGHHLVGDEAVFGSRTLSLLLCRHDLFPGF